MRTLMRRTAYIAGILVALLLAAGLLLNVLVEPNDFKPQMASLVHKLSGLEADFAGDVAFDILPFGLRFKNVSLTVPGGPAGPDGSPLLRIDSLRVEASLMALMQGRIDASALILEGPECNLLRRADGSLNLPEPPVKEVEAQKEHVKVVTRDNETLLFSYSVRDLSVTNASFLYVDQVLGTRYQVLDMELSARDITPRDPFPVHFTCRAQADKPDIEGSLRLQGQLTANPVSRLLAVDEYQLHADLQGPALPHDSARIELSGAASLDAREKRLEFSDLLLLLAASGGFLSQEQKLELSCGQASLDLAGGGLQADTVRLAGPGFDASLELAGTNMTTDPALQAALRVPPFSPRQVLQALKSPPEIADPKALQHMELQADFNADGQGVRLSRANLVLDQATLDLDGSWQPDKRRGRFNLECSSLDLDRYLPAVKNSGESQKQKPTTGGDAKMPDAILHRDFQDLHLEGDLKLRDFRAAGLTLAQAQGHLLLQQGHLQGDMHVPSFYEGQVRTDYTAELTAPGPPLTLSCQASGVQLAPLLKDARGKAPLSGTAAVDAKLRAKGLQSSLLLPTLNGNVSLKAVNGQVYGFSVSPEALRQGGKGGSTSYQEISASGPLKGGVAHLQRISARFSPHSASGSGRVDLVHETLDLHLTANLLQLAGIPVTVQGSWQNPKVSVDAGSAAQGGLEALGQVLQAPETAQEALGTAIKTPEKAGEAIGKGLGEIFRGIMD